jgi:peptidoglycan-associated lipoprotein
MVNAIKIWEKGGRRMLKKNSLWLIVLVFGIAAAFLVSGCAKKQVMKEEAVAKPVAEAKKEAPKPPPAKMEPPKEEAAKPAPMPAPAPMKEAIAPPDLTALRLQFAFDDYSLSNQAKENLEKISSWMTKDGNTKIQIQGNTCEIGTAEYNLALGERRANSAKMYLRGLGISEERLTTISYGEERPLDPGHTEAARSKNRRDDFVQVK